MQSSWVCSQLRTKKYYDADPCVNIETEFVFASIPLEYPPEVVNFNYIAS